MTINDFNFVGCLGIKPRLEQSYVLLYAILIVVFYPHLISFPTTPFLQTHKLH